MSDSQNGSTPHPRRQFLQNGSVGLAAALVGIKVFSNASNVFAQGAKAAVGDSKSKAPAIEMVKPTDPMAATLGYVEDAKKADIKKFPKRAGADGAKQFCYNCQFYLEPKDPAKSEAAPCTIFANKGVKSHGWCNTWTSNPKVKA